MTIDKAIKILTYMGLPNFDYPTEDIMAARKLGAEALKRIKEGRKGYNMAIVDELLGETKESKDER